MCTTDTPAVCLDSVSFLRQGERVLDAVSLTVAHGDFLAILGPNGGGKTTLLRLMLGALEPSSGTVRVFGAAPSSQRSTMGYVPQYSSIRNDFPATVLTMLLMGAAVKRGLLGCNLWPTDTVATGKAMHMLQLLGIEHLAGKPVTALSGGQRQRLLVARALMGKPENAPFLLLLDEPTASIDPEGKFCFYEFLDRMRGQMTIIVVSHDLGMASPFFSTVALVNKSLTLSPSGMPTRDAMESLLGYHSADCPVGRIVHTAESTDRTR